jgi:putative membrane protein
MFFEFARGWWSVMPFMFFQLVFWMALIAAVIWALSHRLHNPTPGMPPAAYHPGNAPSALEILCRRYARGEIDTNTFEHMRERLEASQRHDS